MTDVRGMKPQRASVFRNWRSKLGGGWRLDDNGHNAGLLPKTTKPKVKKVAPKLVTMVQAKQQADMRAELWRKALNLPSIGKLTVK